MRLGWRHGPNLLLSESVLPQFRTLLLCNDQRNAARRSRQGLCWLRRNQAKILLKALPQAFEVVIQNLLLPGVALDGNFCVRTAARLQLCDGSFSRPAQ